MSHPCEHLGPRAGGCNKELLKPRETRHRNQVAVGLLNEYGASVCSMGVLGRRHGLHPTSCTLERVAMAYEKDVSASSAPKILVFDAKVSTWRSKWNIFVMYTLTVDKAIAKSRPAWLAAGGQSHDPAIAALFLPPL